MRLGDGKKAGPRSYSDAGVRQANHEKDMTTEEEEQKRCHSCHKIGCICDRGERL